MMMPVYPGAPWLPKFKGPGDELKLGDWKEQMEGLLGSQELTEPKKVVIFLALANEAKHQISGLEDNEKDTACKIFRYLDSLYGDQTPTFAVRSQFFVVLKSQAKWPSLLFYVSASCVAGYGGMTTPPPRQP